MKISAAQIKSLKGNVEANVEHHKRLIELAVFNRVDVIIFPELSITGYEPQLAKDLATDQNDSRFDDFQKSSNQNNITIGIGMPVKSSNGTLIGMILFQPHQSRLVYAKQYLHEDEYPYFVCGNEQVYLPKSKGKIALAICYELSVPQHAEHVSGNGADVYIASVAKTASGVEKATVDLSNIARRHNMTVLMSNCIGWCDNVLCAGKTSAWNNLGELTGRLSDSEEGLLIVDTLTQKVTQKLM